MQRQHFFMCDESCFSSLCGINLTEGQTWAEKREGKKKLNLKRPFIAFPKDPFWLDWSLLPRPLLTGAWPYSLCGTCSVNWFVNLSQCDAGFAKRLFLENGGENYIASRKQELLVISLAKMFINCKRSFWLILIHIENSLSSKIK